MHSRAVYLLSQTIQTARLDRVEGKIKNVNNLTTAELFKIILLAVISLTAFMYVQIASADDDPGLAKLSIAMYGHDKTLLIKEKKDLPFELDLGGGVTCKWIKSYRSIDVLCMHKEALKVIYTGKVSCTLSDIQKMTITDPSTNRSVYLVYECVDAPAEA